jgi:hypothetical protein
MAMRTGSTDVFQHCRRPLERHAAAHRAYMGSCGHPRSRRVRLVADGVIAAHGRTLSVPPAGAVRTGRCAVGMSGHTVQPDVTMHSRSASSNDSNRIRIRTKRREDFRVKVWACTCVCTGARRSHGQLAWSQHPACCACCTAASALNLPQGPCWHHQAHVWGPGKYARRT